MNPPDAFATATGVRPDGDGGWSASVAEGWDILGNANGGYLLAIAARAMAGAAGRPDPVTVTAHYLSPGRPGPVTARTEVVKQGRRFATVQARLDADRPLLALVGTFGELEPSGGAGLYVEGAPPELPDPDDCEWHEGASAAAGAPSFMDRVELRLHPDDAGFRTGDPSGTPRVRGWFRLPGGEPVDTIGLLQAVDAFPPTVFNARFPVAWTPTVELTAHLRARPAPGWLACAFSTRFVTGGFLEADGEVWDATGTLVAQSRQLALVPRHPTP